MIKNLVTGVFIGCGAILPGISSGVFCVAFGIYEKLIDSVLHFFRDVKKNTKFLLPIILGVFIGVILFSNILKFVFSRYNIPTSFAFIGLILGSLPIIIKQAKVSKITFTHIICMLLSLSLSLCLTALEKTNISSYDINSYSYLLVSGFIMSAGVIVPGVSQTVILMLLGTYETYLAAIASLNLQILIPMGIGLVFGGIICLVLLQFLFKYAKSYTYFFIIGFVLGSVFILYPGFNFNIEGIISIILFLICFVLGYKLS